MLHVLIMVLIYTFLMTDDGEHLCVHPLLKIFIPSNVSSFTLVFVVVVLDYLQFITHSTC